MNSQKLEINVSIQILKPVSEVFEGIVDPEKMSNYFISKGSGRMIDGARLIWNFPEFDLDVPVKVEKVVKDSYISYTWQGEDGKDLLVEMFLEDRGDKTVVRITEKGMENNDAGISWLKGNTEGWANFVACLKGYLEYGIRLREGAFDYRFEGKG